MICRFPEIFRNFGSFWQPFNFYLLSWQNFPYFLLYFSIPMQIFNRANRQFFSSRNLHIWLPTHALSFQLAFWQLGFRSCTVLHFLYVLLPHLNFTDACFFDFSSCLFILPVFFHFYPSFPFLYSAEFWLVYFVPVVLYFLICLNRYFYFYFLS